MEPVIATAIIFFFLINFPMFLTAWDENWYWKSVATIAIIDFFYVLLVFAGLYLISVL